MKSHVTPNTLQINHNKNVGAVVLFVEGEKYEPKLFKHVFGTLLGYKVMKHNRKNKSFQDVTTFQNPNLINSRFFVINLSQSNISRIHTDASYRDKIFREAHTKYHIDFKNCPIYYIWDRDPNSNPAALTRGLLQDFGSAYGDGDSLENGLLLLSYPSAEAYTVSNFQNITCLPDNVTTIKKYIRSQRLDILKINETSLLNAAYHMHHYFNELNIDEYDPADFRDRNVAIFDNQESMYAKTNTYRLLSLISLLLLDLGIIEEVP